MTEPTDGAFTELAEKRQETESTQPVNPSLEVTSINFADVFSNEECDLLKENVIDELWMPIKVQGDENHHKGFRQKLRGDVNGFPFDQIKEVTKAANNQVYGFDLLGIIDQDFPQVFKYTSDCYYNWHIDLNVVAPTRKMTFIINLSDENDYKGGDLEFLNINVSEYKVNTLGKIIVFPSYIPYRITPVTEGEKKIIIGHVHGATFK